MLILSVMETKPWLENIHSRPPKFSLRYEFVTAGNRTRRGFAGRGTLVTFSFSTSTGPDRLAGILCRKLNSVESVSSPGRNRGQKNPNFPGNFSCTGSDRRDSMPSQTAPPIKVLYGFLALVIFVVASQGRLVHGAQAGEDPDLGGQPIAHVSHQ